MKTLRDPIHDLIERAYLCSMSRSDAELVIEAHEKALGEQSTTAPFSKARVLMAYLVYISTTIEKGGDFSKHPLDDLIQNYINLDSSSREEPLSRFVDISDFIAECKKHRAESDKMYAKTQ